MFIWYSSGTSAAAGFSLGRAVSPVPEVAVAAADSFPPVPSEDGEGEGLGAAELLPWSAGSAEASWAAVADGITLLSVVSPLFPPLQADSRRVASRSADIALPTFFISLSCCLAV